LFVFLLPTSLYLSFRNISDFLGIIRLLLSMASFSEPQASMPVRTIKAPKSHGNSLLIFIVYFAIHFFCINQRECQYYIRKMNGFVRSYSNLKIIGMVNLCLTALPPCFAGVHKGDDLITRSTSLSTEESRFRIMLISTISPFEFTQN